MVKIPFTQRDITRLYILIAGLDVLFIVATLLFGLRIRLPFPLIERQLNLTKEVNLATWYSSALLFLAALVAFANSRITPPSVHLKKWYRPGWLGLSLVCLGLSADETSQLHEMLGRWYSQNFGPILGLTSGIGGRPAYAWLLVYSPAIVAAAVGMFLFFRSCFARSRVSLRTAYAGLTCWVGSIAFEYVESQMRRFSPPWGVQGALEEGLEIVGTTCLLIAFTEFLRAQTGVDHVSPEEEGNG